MDDQKPTSSSADAPQHELGPSSSPTSSDSVKAAEERAGESDSEKKQLNKEQQALSNVLGHDPTGGDENWKNSVMGRGKFSARILMKNKKAMLGGAGVGMGLIISLLALFSFIIPFKITHIVESIEQRVGQVPQYAVERRVEYYMQKYLIMRQMAKLGVPDDVIKREFVYLGDGFISASYVNWQGAKLEDEFLREHKLRIEPINNDRSIGRRYSRPSNWRLVNDNVNVDSPRADLRNKTLSSKEARALIKDFSKERTKWYQVLKRHHSRLILKKFYGVPGWKPFEQKIEKTRDKYINSRAATIEKRKKWKREQIKRVVDRVPSRYGFYIDCLTSSEKSCRKSLQKPDAKSDDELLDEGDKSDIDADVDSLTPETPDKATSKRFSKKILDKIRGFGVKKVLGSMVAGAGIVDFLSNVVQALENGNLSQIQYDRVAQTASAFAAPTLSASDQQKSGNLDAGHAQVAAEQYDGYEESPVIQEAFGSEQTAFFGSKVFAQTRSYKGDCDNDGEYDDPLPPKELVCEQYKFIRGKQSWTENPAWKNVLVPISDYSESTLGFILNKVDDIVSSITGAVGLDTAIASILKEFGISDFLAKQFEGLLSEIFGVPGAGGAEIGRDAGERLYAGIANNQASLGGGVGEKREDTIGGAYLKNDQVAQIKMETDGSRRDELNRMNVFARYFSPSVKESITGQLAMSMPASVGGASQKAASIIANPGLIFDSIANIFVRPTAAENAPYFNPFDVVNMGYPLDHPVFTANDGEGMDPDEINAIYKCDKPIDDRPQTGVVSDFDGELPFKVPSEPDPCLLEKVALESATMYFTDTFDDGIDGESSSTDSAGGSGELPPGDAKQLAQLILENSNISLDQRNQIENIANGKGPCPEKSNEYTVDTELLRVVAGLGKNNKFTVSSFHRGCTGSTVGAGTRSKHWKGKAADVSGSRPINGKTMGGSFSNFDDTIQQFIKEAAKLLPAGDCELGVPNSTYQSGAKSSSPRCTNIFLDTPGTTRATGPHVHLGVP